MRTRLGWLVTCVLTVSIAAWLGSCSDAEPQPGISPIPAASSPSPSSIASNSPSAEELNLHKAERAVARFWRVIDRLSADPDSDLTQSGIEGAHQCSAPIKMRYVRPTAMIVR